MSFVSGPVTVRVPASSANLGPGFDSLGLALSLFDEITAEVVDDSGVRIDVTGEGCGAVPLDESHLVARAMRAAFDLMGVSPSGLRLTCRNAIPHGRGLGSSSAAIVGGITVARALTDDDDRLDDVAAFQLAVDLEGHPDNVAAAQLGGLTIAWMDGATAQVERLDVEVPVTVYVPAEPVATEHARGLLPESVSHADAATNAGRAALLVAALTSAPHRLLAATEDRLHQCHRAEAMPDSDDLVRRLRADGVPAVISGAGPTVLAFARGVADRVPPGWAVHELEVEPRGATRI